LSTQLPFPINKAWPLSQGGGGKVTQAADPGSAITVAVFISISGIKIWDFSAGSGPILIFQAYA